VDGVWSAGFWQPEIARIRTSGASQAKAERDLTRNKEHLLKC